MRTSALLWVPVLVVACTFPDVDTTGLDTGSTTSTSSSPSTTTTTTGGPTTGTTSSTGDGGAPSTTASTGEGGGVTTGGGAASDGGGGAGGSTGPGGDGTCADGCDYTATLEGAGGGDTDCDDDGDPNGPDCQPCDAAVFHGQEAFFGQQHLREDGSMSWDYNCSGQPEFDRLFNGQGCSGFGDDNCPDGLDEGTYVGVPSCGLPQAFTTCRKDTALVGGFGDCVSGDEQSNPTVLCH